MPSGCASATVRVSEAWLSAHIARPASTPRGKSCPTYRERSQDFLRVKRTSNLLILVQLYPKQVRMSASGEWGANLARGLYWAL